MNSLEKARKIINTADKEMAKYFEMRMDAVKLVTEYKRENGIPIDDFAREAEMIERNSSLIENEEYREYYVNFLKSNILLSKKMQHKLLNGMTVAYICDIVLVLILLVGIINGLRTGFVQSIIGLLLSVILIVFVVAFLNPARIFLLKFIDLNGWFGNTGNIWEDFILSASNYLAATIIIFSALSLITALILHIAKNRIEDRRIDSPTFAAWDRWLGLVAGLIRGVVSCVLISVVISQPLFFPYMQEDVQKTTITSFLYKTTEDILIDATGMNDDQLTNAMIAYFMGNDLKDATKTPTSEYRMAKITSLVIEFSDFTGNPEKFIEKNGAEGYTKIIIYLSAVADVAAMSPQNEELDQMFLVIFDELISYLPQEDIRFVLTEEQYVDMFDPATGSFYSIRLDEERIEKIREKVCREVCYE